jgi:hypothetical protein
MVYFLYPYFWSHASRWELKKYLDHPDLMHRTFLKSGSARVVLTIRPGFESDFVTYVETGAIGSSHPYLSIAEEMQAFANTNWQLIGPAQPSANRSGLGSAFRIEAFDIDIAKRRARCPSGFLSTQCSRIEESKRQKVSFRLEWSYHCRSCLLRSQCVPAGQPHRTIVVGQYHELLQQRRRD